MAQRQQQVLQNPNLLQLQQQQQQPLIMSNTPIVIQGNDDLKFEDKGRPVNSTGGLRTWIIVIGIFTIVIFLTLVIATVIIYMRLGTRLPLNKEKTALVTGGTAA